MSLKRTALFLGGQGSREGQPLASHRHVMPPEELQTSTGPPLRKTSWRGSWGSESDPSGSWAAEGRCLSEERVCSSHTTRPQAPGGQACALPSNGPRTQQVLALSRAT